MASVLEVMLHGETVGTLTNVNGDRTLFAFAGPYIEKPNRPTLGLGFRDEFGGLISDFRPYQTRLMPFFSNLLPEGPLRTYLAEKAGVSAVREFPLLQALGQDLPGAVVIRSDDEQIPLPDLADLPAEQTKGGVRRDNALRFSLAGVQLKFSAVRNALGGLTVPASGVGGSWIVKLPSQFFEAVPENEFSMMTLARHCGMEVPKIELVEVDSIRNLPEAVGLVGKYALAVRRFDRTKEGSVHMEDFAQVFSVYPEDKYERASLRSIARVLAAEGSAEDAREFVRRIVFNALIGNGDMHLKNWSLIYPDQRAAALAPAYDFLSTFPYIPVGTMALAVSRTKKYSEFDEDELSHLAAKSALPEKLVLDSARETVERFHAAWREEKAHLPMTEKVRTAIEAHIPRVPLAQSG